MYTSVPMNMRRINFFVEAHPDLFRYQTADEVHPHDHLVAWLFLRFVPSYVTPNRLTLARILLTPVVFLVILYGAYTLGIVLFLLTAFTDVLDGSLARTKGLITDFGKLFDPLADKLLIGSIVILLVFQHYPMWVGSVVLLLEIIFIISATVAKVRFKTSRMANVWGKMKMFLQVLAVFATLMGLLWSLPQFFTIGFWLFGIAIGFAIVSLFQHGI
jgi:CDP-diacylglycerol--glycerol-3-phosphate 3-phosphatidyltransferase